VTGVADARAFWDREASLFDDAPDHGLRDALVRRAWHRLLARYITTGPLRIVDVGCGTGSIAVLLAAAGHHVVGIDLSMQMLIRAKAKATAANVTVGLAMADAAQPALRARAFDVVISRHVLWATPDVDETLRCWAELVGPAGALILVEGQWSTGAGVASADVVRSLSRLNRSASVERLDDEHLWGRHTEDDRYLIASYAAATADAARG
jgi:SAM-dependent methyltransferase